MDLISFCLTDKQTAMLENLYIQNRNETGMIVGQFGEADDGTGFVTIGYLSSEKALELQKALGGKPGTLTKEAVEVFTDVE